MQSEDLNKKTVAKDFISVFLVIFVVGLVNLLLLNNKYPTMGPWSELQGLKKLNDKSSEFLFLSLLFQVLTLGPALIIPSKDLGWGLAFLAGGLLPLLPSYSVMNGSDHLTLYFTLILSLFLVGLIVFIVKNSKVLFKKSITSTS